MPYGSIGSSGGGTPNVLQGQTEESSTPLVDTSETGIINQAMLGNEIVLPITYDQYLITGLEWKNGTVVGGNTQAAAVMLDADPPVNNLVRVVAFSDSEAQAGINSVQRASTIRSMVVPGGCKITGMVNTDSAVGRYRRLAGANVNAFKNWTFDNFNQLVEHSAWQANATRMYLKIYFRGIVIL